MGIKDQWKSEKASDFVVKPSKVKTLPINTVKKSNDNEFSVLKSDDDKRLVFGWASIAITEDGEQIEDMQKDVIDPEDLEEAAYEYVLNFRDTGEEHLENYRKKGKLVESCVFTAEKQKAMGLQPNTLPVGWWIGFKIEDDDAWQRIKNGTYRMFSIEGKAERVPIEESVGKGRYGGCGVIVMQDGKVLAGTRIERNGNGKMCGPGGNIKAGETEEEAAVRETFEEFGIVCRDLKRLGTISDGSSTIFLCEDFSGRPKADEREMTDARWIDPAEITQDGAYPPFFDSLALIKDETADDHDFEYIDDTP